MTASSRQNLPDAGWNFDNSYARLPEAFHVRLNPVPVHAPKLVVFNAALAQFLGLNPDALKGDEGAAVFSGNRLPEGAEPLSQAYAGHQFGSFTMLGDGRAILLGEQVTPQGERFDIQCKGSGRTPFSRQGDGRAALGPMLREYIISEALHALGIPTTRSLAVVITGEPVFRETALQGAILTRTAASHIRVGTFEYAAARGKPDELRTLADYTIRRHFPDLAAAGNPYLALLSAVMERQASLVARWLLVGFIHGVMNTDNMALSGETIDYGPCAFMDAYDPNTVFSSIDHNGRYAYGRQPQIAQWNLARFAETLLPLIHENPQEAVSMATGVISWIPRHFPPSLAGRHAGQNRTAEPGGRRRRPGGRPARLHAPTRGGLYQHLPRPGIRFPDGSLPVPGAGFQAVVRALAGPAEAATRTLGGVPPAHELPQPGGHPPQPPGGRGPGGGRGACRLFGHGKTAGCSLPTLPGPAGRGRLSPAATSFGAALPNLLRDVSPSEPIVCKGELLGS